MILTDCSRFTSDAKAGIFSVDESVTLKINKNVYTFSSKFANWLIQSNAGAIWIFFKLEISNRLTHLTILVLSIGYPITYFKI